MTRSLVGSLASLNVARPDSRSLPARILNGTFVVAVVIDVVVDVVGPMVVVTMFVVEPCWPRAPVSVLILLFLFCTGAVLANT